jgi:hypothetical protein
MRRIRLRHMSKIWPVGALLVVLALSGCSAAAAEPEARAAASTVEETSTPTAEPTVESTPTAAPIEITPTEAPSDEFNGFSSARAMFLAGLDGAMSGEVSDEDLVAAGTLACEQLRAGSTIDTARVVTGTGEVADRDNAHIVWQAVYAYCPEML